MIPTNWNLLCQHFDCFFLGGNKKHTLPLIALIDKISERLAGIARVIAINCNASTIVGVLLQNLTSKPSAEDEKVLNNQFFVNYDSLSDWLFPPILFSSYPYPEAGARAFYNLLPCFTPRFLQVFYDNTLKYIIKISLTRLYILKDLKSIISNQLFPLETSTW